MKDKSQDRKSRAEAIKAQVEAAGSVTRWAAGALALCITVAAISDAATGGDALSGIVPLLQGLTG